ncbi:MAG: glucokinase [Pseudomonadota bacterium]
MADSVHSTKTLLVGDIGGTNARFALAEPEGDAYFGELTLQCADFNTPEVAIATFLEQAGAAMPDVICLAVAGPIVDGTARLTNNPWYLAQDSLSATFGAKNVLLINDFEAVAHSLPVVNRQFTRVIGEVPERDLARRDFSVCVLGPGTGLGAAGLVGRDGRVVPLITEAGHVGFAPETAEQADLLAILRVRYGRVSDERLVSGMGIENIYWALGQLRSLTVPPISAAEIFQRARDGDDNLATAAIDLFWEILGQAAGNLVLSTGAFDGAYIAGGIAQRHADLLFNSRFRTGFENKGRHSLLLSKVPTLLIRHPEPGLLGASRRAQLMLENPA